MPTYIMEFDLIHKTADRVFELEEKTEVIVERNIAYARRHLLDKYHKPGKTELKWKGSECIIYHRPGGEVQ